MVFPVSYGRVSYGLIALSAALVAADAAPTQASLYNEKRILRHSSLECNGARDCEVVKSPKRAVEPGRGLRIALQCPARKPHIWGWDVEEHEHIRAYLLKADTHGKLTVSAQNAGDGAGNITVFLGCSAKPFQGNSFMESAGSLPSPLIKPPPVPINKPRPLINPVQGAASSGNPCADSPDPPPNCEPQTMAPVYYGTWWSRTWAYYCTGDHPFYWGPADSSKTGLWNKTSGFTSIENIFAEDMPSKLDSEFTNWYGGQNLVVVMACSSTPPPDLQYCTNGYGPPVNDPGCPQANLHNYCQNSRVPVCFQLFTESCSNGTTYQCTDTFGVIACNKCL